MTEQHSIDRVTNTVFLEQVFAEMLPGTHTMIAGFPGDPNTKDREQSRRNWGGRPWQLGERVPRWFDAYNSYFTVSAFEPDPMTGELRRRKSEFARMHAVMIDDIGTKVPQEKLALRPSTLIETSPGNYQACYILTDDADSANRELCELLVKRMIERGLAIDSKDPGMTGVTRYARLPVGRNAKRKYIEQLGHTFPTRLVTFDPQRRHTVRQIAQAYQLDITIVPHKATPAPISPALARKASAKFSALVEVFRLKGMYHSQHGSWHEITCPWIDQHSDRADTGAALSEPSDDNAWAGGFVCHHGHCRGARGMKDVRAWVRALARELDRW